MSSIKLPLLEGVGGAATQYTPDVGNRLSTGGTYDCQGYTLNDCSVANPNSWAPMVNMAATWEPEGRKQTQ